MAKYISAKEVKKKSLAPVYQIIENEKLYDDGVVKIPKKWQSIFARNKILAVLFFNENRNKLIITDNNIFDFLNKWGFRLSIESEFTEISEVAKTINLKLKEV
jgi:hypothetical protein